MNDFACAVAIAAVSVALIMQTRLLRRLIRTIGLLIIAMDRTYANQSIPDGCDCATRGYDRAEHASDCIWRTSH